MAEPLTQTPPTKLHELRVCNVKLTADTAEGVLTFMSDPKQGKTVKVDGKEIAHCFRFVLTADVEGEPWQPSISMIWMPWRKRHKKNTDPFLISRASNESSDKCPWGV